MATGIMNAIDQNNKAQAALRRRFPWLWAIVQVWSPFTVRVRTQVADEEFFRLLSAKGRKAQASLWVYWGLGGFWRVKSIKYVPSSTWAQLILKIQFESLGTVIKNIALVRDLPSGRKEITVYLLPKGKSDFFPLLMKLR